MNSLLFAKGGDITASQAVRDFAAAYQQALLELAASARDGGSEAVFSDTCAALDAAMNTHQEILENLRCMIEEVSSAQPSRLRELTVAFYDDLYRHFGHFRSATAFYRMSMAFLCQVSDAIITQTTVQSGLNAATLPEMTLIAVGPSGRGEYSPFCQLQTLLVHEEASASQLRTINLFCTALHDGFEAAGIAVDPVVSPRNPSWRGSSDEWRERCKNGLHLMTDEGMINLCRLIDQYPLHPGDGLARDLKQISSAALIGNRSALANLVGRMTSLSNGLGIMGGLKLERSGRERGLFSLLDHGLLPFSAALSALALITHSPYVSSCERILELLQRGELDVDTSERMLETWHSLHNLRLLREQSFRHDEHASRTLYLDPKEMTSEQRQSLKETLESIAIIQRHVEIIFSGMGE